MWKGGATFTTTSDPAVLLLHRRPDQEDGSFHAEFPDFDGHNGFDQRELKLLMEQAVLRLSNRIFFIQLSRKESISIVLDGGKKE